MRQQAGRPVLSPGMSSARSRCDFLARLRYRSEFQFVYFIAVVLATVLLLAVMVGDNQVHTAMWFLLSEAFLTGFFLLEVVVQMALTGPSKYLTSRDNLFELVLCVACCIGFGLSVSKGMLRVEVESLLLVVRYSTQLARVYYFVKAHRSQMKGMHSKVQLHTHDNPAISVNVHNPTAERNCQSPPARFPFDHVLSSGSVVVPTEFPVTSPLREAAASAPAAMHTVWSHSAFDDEDSSDMLHIYDNKVSN